MLYRLYPLIIVLQVYCIYHAYKNGSERYWYFIIFIFPFLGSILYLYKNVYNRQQVSNLKESAKLVINSNYEVEQLEKEVKFSDTIANKSRLAEKYIEVGRYSEAVNLYKSCLDGFNKNDTYTLMNLVKACYLNNDFEKAIFYGNKLIDNYEFQSAEQKIAYAWSFYELGDIDKAEKVFEEMDHNYSNHLHRKEYASFLIKLDRKEEAKKKLIKLREEFGMMTPIERRGKKAVEREVASLLKEV